MRKFLLSLLILLPALQMSAEEINAIVLHLASGKTVTCQLDEQPVVTFSGDELVITTHMNKVSYQSSDVLRFTYTYVDPSAINSVRAGGTQFSVHGNAFTATSLEPNTKVTAYTTDGKEVASAVVTANGSVSLNLPSASGTIYIIKTSVANFKIAMP